MDVVIAGGHGQIARRLASLLTARGDTVRGLIRNPGHAAAVRATGADPVVCDLEAAVTASDRAWTVVRPGRLTDEPGSDRVRVQAEPFRGEIARDDVAALLAAVLAEPRAAGATLYVNSGDEPVEQALAQAL